MEQEERFFYIGEDTIKIDDKTLIAIYVLNIRTKTIHKIYHQNTKELQEFLSSLDYFQEVSALIRFVIKRDGKISLDIIY